jgi:geranylgeranyl diphosphate synthase type II
MLDFDKARQLIESELDKIPFNRTPAELYDPVRYILSLGGKRMRPALTLMACSVFSDAVHQAVKPALAFEIFHNFTLLHDDLMDHSALRRGKETVHEKWDPNVAILSGDVMSILSYRILADTDEKNLRELFQLFNTTAMQVCEGQQWDMNFETRMEVSVEEYLNMIEHKTAVLIAACLKAGAITGGADELGSDLMYEFGRNLGMAFQIRDDYLDVFGDPKIFGKRIGNDILNNKKTFLLIKALELSRGKVKKELIEWLQGTDFDPLEKVRRVTEILTELKIDAISAGLAATHYDKAIQYLERIEVPSERKAELAEFARKMVQRKK